MIGIAAPSRLDGEPRVLRVLESNASDAPSAVFAEENHLAMIRTFDHKLVHYIDEPLGELYDLGEDPAEINNLYTSADHLQTRRELERRLLDWLASSNYQNSGYRNLSDPMYEVKWL
jgi:arylsulfatase A-like enzyme